MCVDDAVSVILIGKITGEQILAFFLSDAHTVLFDLRDEGIIFDTAGDMDRAFGTIRSYLTSRGTRCGRWTYSKCTGERK